MLIQHEIFCAPAHLPPICNAIAKEMREKALQHFRWDFRKFDLLPLVPTMTAKEVRRKKTPEITRRLP